MYLFKSPESTHLFACEGPAVGESGRSAANFTLCVIGNEAGRPEEASLLTPFTHFAPSTLFTPADPRTQSGGFS